MTNIPVQDANAHEGCGCSGHDEKQAAVQEHVHACGCGPDCTCGCQDGKPCTCTPEQKAAEGGAAQATCNCGPECDCGCQEGKPCTCGEAGTPASAPLEGAQSYTVSGMTCEHCVKAVTEEVSAIPGVSDVEVDLATGRLDVVSDAPVDFDRIVEAVAEAGDYTVE